ncbi:hypothetical protein AALA54_13745 [Oscillospiraceae bacterium 44-34]|jgi:hypothetical protein
MRKFLRNMARAKMKRMGYSNVNLKMRGHWREIIGAYPVNIITGQQMSKSFRGRKKNKKGSYSSLFAY